MTDDINTENDEHEKVFHLFSYFLEAIPPNQLVYLSDIAETRNPRNGSGRSTFIAEPEIRLFCSHEKCDGTRFFRYKDKRDIFLSNKGSNYFYMTYLCSNCQINEKTFSIAVCEVDDEYKYGKCYKIGEIPAYGPPLPSRVFKLVGTDREIFLKGKRSENFGLGIGSFVYYRRVVENQKNKIINEILKVSERIGASEDKIQLLKDSIKETQFSKSFDLIKDAVPESLLINGSNPITMLHDALSNGVHNLSDEECLELASSIRIVLVELSERLSQALKNEAELTNAVTLLNIKRKKI